MLNRFAKPGGIALAGVALTTVLAMRAPERAVVAAAAPTTPAVAPVAAPVSSYAPVVDAVMPAVVTIRTERRAQAIQTDGQIPDDLLRRFFGGNGDDDGPRMQRRRAPRGLEVGVGSGVIVSRDGYILTNNHVVDGADQVRVEMSDKRVLSAKVVGTDPATDLAVVRVEGKELPMLNLGDSDAVRVGDVVLAVGNPLNIGETVTSGIISAKGRRTDLGGDGYEDFLQTDAPINHGNSGGALVNTSGQLIGINSQIVSPSDGNIGIGFAIPSNMAKNVMDQLIKDGSVRRGKLGVTVQGITADMATAMNLPSASGALVSNVDDGSPADRAGLKQGDVIVQYNGRAVNDNNQLRNAVASTVPGTSVALQVLRNGHTENLKATVAELDVKRTARGTQPDGKGSGKYGMSIEPLTPDTAEQLGVGRGTRGVVVADLDPEGLAAESGLAQGDVIEKVNGTAVTSTEAVKSALDGNSGKPSLLLINRKGTEVFLTLAPR